MLLKQIVVRHVATALWRRARKVALDRGMTMGQVVNEALTMWLKAREG